MEITRSVSGVHAPSPRFTLTAAMLVALALSTTFVVVCAGFTFASAVFASSVMRD